MVTVNQMILDTLKTKTDKEPKYRDTLYELGYEVEDCGNSNQHYWQVDCLVISRNHLTNKSELLKPYTHVCWYKNIKHVDFAALIDKQMKRIEEAKAERESYVPTHIERYKKAKKEIAFQTYWLEEGRKDKKKLEYEIKSKDKEIQKCLDEIEKAQKEIDELVMYARVINRKDK